MNTYLISVSDKRATVYLNGSVVHEDVPVGYARKQVDDSARKQYVASRRTSVIWEDLDVAGLTLRTVIGRRVANVQPWVQTDAQTYFTRCAKPDPMTVLRPPASAW